MMQLQLNRFCDGRSKSDGLQEIQAILILKKLIGFLQLASVPF